MSQPANLGSGNYFAPLTAVSRWSAKDSWQSIQVTEHSALLLTPFVLALHYRQAIFEGMKAYVRPTGAASLFKPYRWALRFNLNAAMLSMSTLRGERIAIQEGRAPDEFRWMHEVRTGNPDGGERLAAQFGSAMRVEQAGNRDLPTEPSSAGRPS